MNLKLCFSALVLAVTLSGCLGAPTVVKREYFSLSPSLSVIHGEPLDKTLGIRSLDVAKPYSSSMAYLASSYKISYRNAQEWAERPGDTVTRALIDALAASGRFKDVGDAAEMARPDYILTGELRTFVEDRTTSPPSALIEVRIAVREAQDKELLWIDTLKFSEPLDAGTDASAFAAAMTRAIEKLVETAAIGITSAEPR